MVWSEKKDKWKMTDAEHNTITEVRSFKSGDSLDKYFPILLKIRILNIFNLDLLHSKRQYSATFSP